MGLILTLLALSGIWLIVTDAFLVGLICIGLSMILDVLSD